MVTFVSLSFSSVKWRILSSVRIVVKKKYKTCNQLRPGLAHRQHSTGHRGGYDYSYHLRNSRRENNQAAPPMMVTAMLIRCSLCAVHSLQLFYGKEHLYPSWQPHEVGTAIPILSDWDWRAEWISYLLSCHRHWRISVPSNLECFITMGCQVF
jgi:hypothetical protein